MVETRCVKVILRENSLPEVIAWADELNKRKDEVTATLAAEGVSFESVFLLKEETGYALIYVMRADDFDNARKVARSSSSYVDRYHEQFKANFWAEVKTLEKLIDFECPETKNR